MKDKRKLLEKITEGTNGETCSNCEERKSTVVVDGKNFCLYCAYLTLGLCVEYNKPNKSPKQLSLNIHTN